MGQIFIKKTFETKLACLSKSGGGHRSRKFSAIVNILVLEKLDKVRINIFKSGGKKK